jgi:hypothetical protein
MAREKLRYEFFRISRAALVRIQQLLVTRRILRLDIATDAIGRNFQVTKEHLVYQYMQTWVQ